MIPRLWYITDGVRASGARPLVDVIRAAARGGVGAVLLRELALGAAAIGELCRDLKPLRDQGLRVFLSRRLDLARAFGVDGVQLTADSVPLADARAWLARDGAPLLLGYSAHSLAEAESVAAQGADYVTLSPIFSTDSKPSVTPLGLAELARASHALPVPVLALGGLTPERAASAVQAGAHGIAAASGIGAAGDVEAAARTFHRSLMEHHTSCTRPG